MMNKKAICLFAYFFCSSLYALPPPDLISFSSGIFDFLREKYRTCEFSIEYKCHVSFLKSPFRFLDFRPLLGLMATVEGTTYLYAGVNLDLFPCEHLVIAPGFAAGWYRPGHGKDLGYPIEFRSGVEIAWQFDDWRRLGVHFYHLSNASLGRRNPGAESIVLFYDIPIRKGFPFK